MLLLLLMKKVTNDRGLFLRKRPDRCVDIDSSVSTCLRMLHLGLRSLVSAWLGLARGRGGKLETESCRVRLGAIGWALWV